MNACWNRWKSAALLALGAWLPGCGVDSWAFSSITSTGQGATLVLVWKDSPLDADRLWVALDRVELLGGAAPVVLLDQREEHDVLSLQNGVRVTFDAKEVPAGTYSTLRLTFAPESAGRHRIEVDGTTHAMDFARPGGERLDLPGTYVVGARETLRWVLDLNARLSAYEAAGDWFFDPHVAWTPDDATRLLRGTVRTAAGQPVANAVVSAQRGGLETSSCRTRADGSFELGPLPAATYTLVATAPGALPAASMAAPVPGPAVSLQLTDGSGPPGDGAGLAPVGLVAGVVKIYGGGLFLGQAGVDPFTGAFDLPALAPGLYTFVLHDASGAIDTLLDRPVLSGFNAPLDFGP